MSFDHAALPSASGICFGSFIDFDEIRDAAVLELDRPAEHLLATNSVCFLSPAPPLLYPRNLTEAEACWTKGMGMALQHVETRNSAINRFCGRVADQESCRVSASLYVSKPGYDSMAVHSDDWDGFLIQVHGSKDFHLNGFETPFDRIRLTTANWLWLPRGVEHRVETPETLSVHLSVNLHRHTPNNSMNYLLPD